MENQQCAGHQTRYVTVKKTSKRKKSCLEGKGRDILSVDVSFVLRNEDEKKAAV